jgi:serine/threonine protein phosphatase PrpC
MSATLRIDIGQHSEAGRKPLNQDFHGAVVPADALLATKGVVLALADGISSSPVSQVASSAAVRSFLEDYYLTSEAWPVRRAAQRVLQATNSWLHAQTQRGEGRFDKNRGHVCTFSALVFKGREAHLLHVGDTRIYRLHPQALEQLTEDHRVRVSETESYLGQALGMSPALEIDYQHWTAEVGEVYLLATDGVYEHLDAAAVHAALAASAHDLDATAHALVHLALQRGSTDNLTLQLARVAALPAEQAEQLLARRDHLALPPALQPRMVFDGYTVVRELQSSARSHIHLAVDTETGQHVVLKTPSIDLRDQPAYLDRFMLEEWVARRLDSAHVLKPCANSRPRQHLYVAMEYINGQTLAQWMVDNPRPDLDTARGLVQQIAKGLQAFHRKEMLHQDLRPENIMIDRTGTVKIIDFGAVHVAGLAESTRQPQAQAIVGSLQYTAPEYFTGAGGTPLSDLFSLAVLTYQLLTGQLPYGLQVTQVRGPADLHKLRYESVRTQRRELPVWLDSVLQQALQPQPAKRHQALSAFVHDLQHPAAQHLRDQQAPWIERDPVKFWRGLALALGLLVVVLVARLAGVSPA